MSKLYTFQIRWNEYDPPVSYPGIVYRSIKSAREAGDKMLRHAHDDKLGLTVQEINPHVAPVAEWWYKSENSRRYPLVSLEVFEVENRE